MGRNGTSLREQEVYYFVHKFFPDAINRYKIDSPNKLIEVDIFIPSLALVIEYDGSYWHKNKIDTDNQKNKILNELKYKVLRVREYGLPDLEEFYGDVIDLPYVHLNEINFDHINLTLKYLATKADSALSAKINAFYVDDEEHKQALKNIYALRYPDVIEPNLSDMCGIEYWDNEVNYPLEVNHVHEFDWVPAVLICENGRKMTLPRYHRNFKEDCLSHKFQCDKCCCGVMCSLVRFCKKNDAEKISCSFVENKVWNMIKHGETLKDYEYFYTFKRWMSEESDIGEKIIRKFLSYSPRSKKREDIAYFLGLERETYKRYVKENCFDIYSMF